MHKPRHSWWAVWMLNRFLKYKFGRSFSSVTFHGDLEPGKRATLLIANHSSWWDGFIIWQLNRLHFKKRFHVCMLENQLNAFPLFKHVGAIGITPGNRGILTSLSVCKEVLANPANVLLYFPQGRIDSVYDALSPFQSGVGKLLKAQADVKMVAMFTEFGSHEKPMLHVQVKNLPETEFNPTPDALQKAYHTFFEQSKSNYLATFKH